MTVRLTIFCVGILFLIACDKLFDRGEIITSDYEPELNVYGLVSFDEIMGNPINPTSSSFVRVHRTLALNENPQGDTAFHVYDADVTITASSGYSTKFLEPYESETGTYIDLFDEFVPDFETDYTLEINAQNGMSVTGILHTPPRPIFKLLPEVINPDSFFTITWEPYVNAMARVQVKGWGAGCNIEKNKYFENGETEWTTKIFSCYNDEEGYYSDNPENLSIQLTFMDTNYYDYFINYSGDGFFNFLMGIYGNTQEAYGVIGGLGVFGSYATETAMISFDP